MLRTLVNFGQNLTLRAEPLLQPRSEAHVLTALAEHRGKRILAIGSLHCWGRAVAIAQDFRIPAEGG